VSGIGLPNRRPHTSSRYQHFGIGYVTGIHNGELSELFTVSTEGFLIVSLAHGSAILSSLLLHGYPAASIRRALGRASDGPAARRLDPQRERRRLTQPFVLGLPVRGRR
jgi:hypothetical protein